MAGNIAYHFKDGSNPWWVAVQVRNHRNPLAQFEVLQNGGWASLPRQQWNYFWRAPVWAAGRSPSRVTDVFGNQDRYENVPLLDDELPRRRAVQRSRRSRQPISSICLP